MSSPFTLVIFGATGDLMRSKLLPSLFRLYKEKKLPDKFYIVGFARRPMTNQEFKEMLLGLISLNSFIVSGNMLSSSYGIPIIILAVVLISYL